MSETIRLFCLPCAGASATMYLRWRRQLPAWIQIVPIELPGRGVRMSESFVEDFDRLVAQLYAEHAGEFEGQFALLGHSMGALLAYAITCRLLEQGGSLPLALIASGSPAPSRRDAEPLPAKGDDEGLLADLRKQGGTPEEIFNSPEFVRITLDVLGADYRVVESFRYRAARRLPMPVHVLSGRDDDSEGERMVAWGDEAGSEFSLDWFRGGHFFIRESEGQVLTVVARHLSNAVQRRRRAISVPG